MVGFFTAFHAELAAPQGVLQQLASAWPQVLLVSALITAASWFPISKGAKKESFGVFTPTAESLNGRMVSEGRAGYTLCWLRLESDCYDSKRFTKLVKVHITYPVMQLASA